MIEHKSYETQGFGDRYQPPTLEEMQAERASKKAYETEQIAKQEAAQAARDAILDPIRARLAAGTVTPARLQIVTGLKDHQIKTLLEGGSVAQYGWGETDQALADLGAWLQDADSPPEDDAAYAVTPTFTTLQNLFAAAHQNCDLIAITGAWGIGKTQAAQYYAATHARTYSRPGAVRIQFSEADAKPAAVLAKIANHLNIPSHAYRNGNLFDGVVAALTPRDLLLLEECQLLGDALNIVASLHDAVDCGIVTLGNPDMGGMVWGKSTKFSRLASRANRFDFPCTTPADVEAYLAWHGLPDGLDSAERQQLSLTCIKIACVPEQRGGLRALADVTRIAQNYYPDQRLTGPLFMQLAAQLKPQFTPPKGRAK